MRVAIVTFEFEGFTKNGGIGTAYKHLADHLIKQGHSVTVVFQTFRSENSNDRLKKTIGNKIKFVVPNRIPSKTRQQSPFLLSSLEVYEYLRKEKFDIVHAPDNGGLLYFSILAKRAALDFKNCQFIIGCHGPISWVDKANGTYSTDSIQAAKLERMAVAFADWLISPSAYMIEYLKSEKWHLPRNVKVIPNLNKITDRAIGKKTANKQVQKTLVFFGRLEPRKGIQLFTESIEKLLNENSKIGIQKPLHIVFLGKDGGSIVETTSAFIKKRLSVFRKRLTVEFLDNLSSQESLSYLRNKKNALICVPSLTDNSPYVIVEAIELGLDLITTDVGGIAELIHPSDHDQVICSPNTAQLARLIHKRLFSAPRTVKFSSLAARANDQWALFHNSVLNKKKRAPTPKGNRKKPLISIVVGVNRLSTVKQLRESLRSLQRQTYRHFEVCTPESNLTRLPKNLLMNKKIFSMTSGKSIWTQAIRAATGKYILFLDGACFQDHHSLEQWVIAAEAIANASPANVATFGIIESEPPEIEPIFESSAKSKTEYLLTLADNSLLGTFEPLLGICNALWNRKALMRLDRRKAINFEWDLTAWSTVTSAASEGSTFTCLPRILLKIQDQELLKSVLQEKGHYRINAIQPFLENASPEWKDIALHLISIRNQLVKATLKYAKAELKLELLKEHIKRAAANT